jgi:hypothetical protein
MQRFGLFLLFSLILCGSAFPQERGTIQCEPGSMTLVPAWIAPGRPHVVEHLNCGQMVSVVDVGSFLGASQYSSRPPEYVKILIGDKEAYVDARYVKLLGSQEPLKVNKPGQDAARQNPQEEEEQKKWRLIAKESVKVRDEALADPIYTYGPRTFKGTVSNTSEFPLTHIHMLLRIYDCAGKAKSDYSNCEIIGEVKPVFAAPIPAHQTRLVTGAVTFEATPRVRGAFAWGYQVLGARAE